MGLIDTVRKAQEYDAIEKAANDKKIMLANEGADRAAMEAAVAKEGLAGLLAEHGALKNAVAKALWVPEMKPQGVR